MLPLPKRLAFLAVVAAGATHLSVLFSDRPAIAGDRSWKGVVSEIYADATQLTAGQIALNYVYAAARYAPLGG